MIRHILLVRAIDDATPQLQRAFEQIAALESRLSGLIAVTWGRSKSPEDLERGYTHGLVADFANGEALRVYAEDPVHRAAGQQIIDAAEGGIDGLLVVDLELS